MKEAGGMQRINRIMITFALAIVVIVVLFIPVAAAAQSGSAPLGGQRSAVLVPVGTSRSDLIIIARSAKIEGEVTGSVVAVAGVWTRAPRCRPGCRRRWPR